jgi:hypothetical protein
MCPKIDVMERECKKLKIGRDLNKALVLLPHHYLARSFFSSQSRR